MSIKKCANCEKEIDLSKKDGNVLNSIRIPLVSYALCDNCKEVNVDLGEHKLILLRHIMSDIIRQDAIDVINRYVADEKNTSIKNQTSKKDMYVILNKEGNIVDAIKADNEKQLIKALIKHYGEEALINEDIKIYELNQIKPIFKKKTIYELDM